jgi:4-alpha-glucanotransferase
LVGLSLDDLTGEVEPVNLPGAGPERYPSWTRRMRTPLEVAMRSDDVRVALRCSGRARGSRVAGERRLHRS